jgi:hypothetical protein
MKFAVRQGLFETNSSNTHSLTIATEDEYNKWVDGKVLYDKYNGKFLTMEEAKKKLDAEGYCDEIKEFAVTFKEYEEPDYDNYLESFKQRYTSPSGDKLVIFGEYGRDG